MPTRDATAGGVAVVLAGRALLVVVLPVLHEDPLDPVALRLQHQRRDGGVDATGKPDHDVHAGVRRTAFGGGAERFGKGEGHGSSCVRGR